MGDRARGAGARPCGRARRPGHPGVAGAHHAARRDAEQAALARSSGSFEAQQAAQAQRQPFLERNARVARRQPQARACLPRVRCRAPADRRRELRRRAPGRPKSSSSRGRTGERRRVHVLRCDADKQNPARCVLAGWAVPRVPDLAARGRRGGRRAAFRSGDDANGVPPARGGGAGQERVPEPSRRAGGGERRVGEAEREVRRSAAAAQALEEEELPAAARRGEACERASARARARRVRGPRARRGRRQGAGRAARARARAGRGALRARAPRQEFDVKLPVAARRDAEARRGREFEERVRPTSSARAPNWRPNSTPSSSRLRRALGARGGAGGAQRGVRRASGAQGVRGQGAEGVRGQSAGRGRGRGAPLRQRSVLVREAAERARVEAEELARTSRSAAREDPPRARGETRRSASCSGKATERALDRAERKAAEEAEEAARRAFEHLRARALLPGAAVSAHTRC